jgi:hypothetical protein
MHFTALKGSFLWGFGPVHLLLKKTAEIVIALLLLSTAILKIQAAVQNISIMAVDDPIIHLPNRAVSIGVGLLELGVGGYLLFGRSVFIKLSTTGWLALCFSAYRVGVWLAHVAAPCACLGSGYEWWPWLEANLADAATAVFWLFFGLTLLRISLELGNLKLNNKPRENI